DRGPIVLALPRVFAAPLAFDAAAARPSWTRAAGRALGRLGASTVATAARPGRSWTRAPGGMLVRLDESSFANADLAGTAAGTWRGEATGPGAVDMQAQLTRAGVGP